MRKSLIFWATAKETTTNAALVHEYLINSSVLLHTSHKGHGGDVVVAELHELVTLLDAVLAHLPGD
jgi:hypothetical protein